MKMTPLASGGMPGANLVPNTQPTQPEAGALAEALNIKKIKMRTNASPDRFDTASIESATTEQGATADKTVQAPVVEDTKPLSPQVAALAKERRAIQRERMELEAEKKAIASKLTSDVSPDLIAKLKSKPLSTLLEHGVTYDQITEELLAQSTGINPDIKKLEDKIESVQKTLDQNLQERDRQAEQQVLTQMLDEAETLAKEGDEFSLIKDEDESAYREVLNRIYSNYKKTGQVLEVRDVMQKLENELLEKRLKYAQHTKVQSRLIPPAQPVQQRPNQMRTLTSRDSSSAPLSRRERAILAMKGSLTKG